MHVLIHDIMCSDFKIPVVYVVLSYDKNTKVLIWAQRFEGKKW